MKRVFIFLVFFLLGCSRHPTPYPGGSLRGDEVGNGGDFIRILMEEGRLYAFGVVTRIRNDSFPSNIGDYLQAGELDWLLQNKNSIAEDIRQSQYAWLAKRPEGCPKEECGCALQGERKVYFAQAECETKLSKRQEAAKLLIHESMHHFVGSDEAKAKRLGVALYAAWYNMGHPDSPHWKIFRSPREVYTNSYSLWNGKELIVWRDGIDKSEIDYYDPSTSSWRFETVNGSPLKKLEAHQQDYSYDLIPSVFSVWADQRAFLFSSLQVTGYTYDKELNSWREGKSGKIDGLTADRLVSINGKVLAWYKPSSQFHLSTKPFGQVYDPVSDVWKPMSGVDAPEARLFSEPIAAGGEMVVWGGTRCESSNNCGHTNTGAFYDPNSDRWSGISLKGAPSPREFPGLVWTGKELLVYGGKGQKDDEFFLFLAEGGAYNPKTKKWRPIKNGPTPFITSGRVTMKPIHSVWTGTEALFLNESRIDAYNPFRDEWILPKESINFPDTLLDEMPVWTGMEMIVWDGKTNTGYLYYP